jgi:hypothetical protein
MSGAISLKGLLSLESNCRPFSGCGVDLWVAAERERISNHVHFMHAKLSVHRFEPCVINHLQDIS